MADPDEENADYLSRTRASASLYSRLRAVMPGGETRSVTYYPPYPVAISHGAGGRVWDLDGNVYFDVLNNYTSLIHGHAAPAILEEVMAAVRSGTAHPAPTMYQLQLAELLTSRFPAVEMVRLTNSGTEAAILALRIARRATGRRRFVMFDGGYHGTAPEFVDDGPDVVTVPYNDPAALAAAVDHTIAAIFAEPFLGSGGVIPAADGFLAAAGEIAASAGSLLVLDEVQSLRSAYGGVQSQMGRPADLVLMGKIIGGGFPVGAVGGRRSLMTLTAADQPGSLRHSGTFNGNPVTSAAGLATLRLLDNAAIGRLNRLAAALAEQIAASGRTVGIPVVVTRAGSIMHVHFAEREPRIAADTSSEPSRAVSALHVALLRNGVYAAPRGMLNLSTALTESDIDGIAAAYEVALSHVARVTRLVAPNSAR